MICVTSPMWIFIYLGFFLSVTNKTLVNQASSGRLTVSRLLGGRPINDRICIFGRANPLTCPLLAASVLSAGGSGSVRGERLDHVPQQPQETPPDGGSMALMWRGGDEGVASSVPERPPQAALVPVAPDHAALPHQHLPAHRALRGRSDPGRLQRDGAVRRARLVLAGGALPLLHGGADVSDLPPSHPETTAGAQFGRAGADAGAVLCHTALLPSRSGADGACGAGGGGHVQRAHPRPAAAHRRQVRDRVPALPADHRALRAQDRIRAVELSIRRRGEPQRPVRGVPDGAGSGHGRILPDHPAGEKQNNLQHAWCTVEVKSLHTPCGICKMLMILPK